jgi:hypothetical protein
MSALVRGFLATLTALAEAVDRFIAWRHKRRAQRHRRWLRDNGVIMPRNDGAHLPTPDYRRWSDQYMESIRRGR